MSNNLVSDPHRQLTQRRWLALTLKGYDNA
jgi:hypothetical protein